MYCIYIYIYIYKGEVTWARLKQSVITRWYLSNTTCLTHVFFKPGEQLMQQIQLAVLDHYRRRKQARRR